MSNVKNRVRQGSIQRPRDAVVTEVAGHQIVRVPDGNGGWKTTLDGTLVPNFSAAVRAAKKDPIKKRAAPEAPSKPQKSKAGEADPATDA